jgi:hypothetical protein
MHLPPELRSQKKTDSIFLPTAHRLRRNAYKASVLHECGSSHCRTVTLQLEQAGAKITSCNVGEDLPRDTVRNRHAWRQTTLRLHCSALSRARALCYETGMEVCERRSRLDGQEVASTCAQGAASAREDFEAAATAAGISRRIPPDGIFDRLPAAPVGPRRGTRETMRISG